LTELRLRPDDCIRAEHRGASFAIVLCQSN
jgi:hypothetical protein